MSKKVAQAELLEESAPVEVGAEEPAAEAEMAEVVEEFVEGPLLLFGKKLFDCVVFEVRHWLRHTEDAEEIRKVHEAEAKGQARPNVLEACQLRLNALSESE